MILHVYPQKPWPMLKDHLDGLVKHAESGEILGIFEVILWRGDTVSSGWCAQRPDRRVIGALEELKHELIAKLK
jgi:hypothetical protein